MIIAITFFSPQQEDQQHVFQRYVQVSFVRLLCSMVIIFIGRCCVGCAGPRRTMIYNCSVFSDCFHNLVTKFRQGRASKTKRRKSHHKADDDEISPVLSATEEDESATASRHREELHSSGEESMAAKRTMRAKRRGRRRRWSKRSNTWEEEEEEDEHWVPGCRLWETPNYEAKQCETSNVNSLLIFLVLAALLVLGKNLVVGRGTKGKTSNVSRGGGARRRSGSSAEELGGQQEDGDSPSRRGAPAPSRREEKRSPPAGSSSSSSDAGGGVLED